MNTDAIPAAAFELAAALRAAAADPADGVRLLLALADLGDASPTGILLRQAALIEAARAGADYQPVSYEDAQALLALLCGRLDAEILRAGDAGEDRSYVAFRALRIAVAQDLTARGDPLPRLRRVSLRQSAPASVLAQGLYGDADRADELVSRADPEHPLFMPAELVVLDR